MANVSRVRGFRAVSTLSGAPVNGATMKYTVAAGNATAVFPGDVMALNDDGTVSPCAAGGLILGVCAAVVVDKAVAATEHPGYLPASTAGVVLLHVGQDIIYEAQEDSVGGALAATAVGSNVDLIAGAGSTTTGASGHLLDSSTSTDAAPGTAQFRILALDSRVDNEIGASAKWLVRINENVITNVTGL